MFFEYAPEEAQAEVEGWKPSVWNSVATGITSDLARRNVTWRHFTTEITFLRFVRCRWGFSKNIFSLNLIFTACFTACYTFAVAAFEKGSWEICIHFSFTLFALPLCSSLDAWEMFKNKLFFHHKKRSHAWAEKNAFKTCCSALSWDLRACVLLKLSFVTRGKNDRNFSQRKMKKKWKHSGRDCEAVGTKVKKFNWSSTPTMGSFINYVTTIMWWMAHQGQRRRSWNNFPWSFLWTSECWGFLSNLNNIFSNIIDREVPKHWRRKTKAKKFLEN